MGGDGSSVFAGECTRETMLRSCLGGKTGSKGENSGVKAALVLCPLRRKKRSTNRMSQPLAPALSIYVSYQKRYIGWSRRCWTHYFWFRLRRPHCRSTAIGAYLYPTTPKCNLERFTATKFVRYRRPPVQSHRRVRRRPHQRKLEWNKCGRAGLGRDEAQVGAGCTSRRSTVVSCDIVVSERCFGSTIDHKKIASLNFCLTFCLTCVRRFPKRARTLPPHL